MSLDKTQYRELDAALNSAFPDIYATLQRALLYSAGKRLEYYAPNTDTMPNVIFKLIQGAVAESWVYDLVAAAINERPNNQLLKDFIKKYPNFDPSLPAPKLEDFYDAYFVLSNYLFIGRRDLRRSLRELRESEESTRILLVVGKRVSGKTYTQELINYLASKSARHKVIPLNLDKFTYKPYDICLEIAQKMGLEAEEIETIPIQQEEQTAKYVQFLCNWVHRQIVRTEDKVFWFIFDGFRSMPLLPEVNDMIAELANRIEKQLRDKCYLVLLNYTNILPPDLEFYAFRESIKVIDKDDLRAFFEKLFEDNGKDYSSEVLNRVVEEIFEQTEAKIIADASGDIMKLQALQEERLKYLSRATNEAVRRYKQNNFEVLETEV